MRRSTESKALHANLITRANATSQQTQVNGSSTSAQRHHLTRQLRAIAVLRNESLEIILKTIHVRTQRHHPVGIKCLLHVFLFLTSLAHVSQTKINSLSFFHFYFVFKVYSLTFSPISTHNQPLIPCGSPHKVPLHPRRSQPAQYGEDL